MARRVLMVAGEASGDLHGAGVVRALRELDPAVTVSGIGGAHLRAAGAEVLYDNAELAVVGLVEVLGHFSVIARAFLGMRRLLKESKPDLLILIDYPDFNLRLAKVAKAAGVPVLYYISPQVWAWRSGRVHKIARLVDQMAVVFPFEVPFYRQAGAAVSFVGHPLRDTVHSSLGRDEARQAFGLDPARPVVGLFPGSRQGEVRRLFADILAAARLLRERHPEVQFLLPRAPSLQAEELAPYLEQAGVPVTVVAVAVAENPYAVMQACDAIVTVSGTVTLEIALMGVPMVIVYRFAPLTYQLGRLLVKVENFGLCNIVAGERVVPELLQDQVTPERIVAEIEPMLVDAQYAARIRTGLAGVREKLGQGGAAANVARLAIDLMSARRA